MPPAVPELGNVENRPSMPPRDSTMSTAETSRAINQRISALRTSQFSQFTALMRKNSVLQWRQQRTNLAQIAFPLAMICLLLLFQVLIDQFLSGNPDFEIPADLNPKVYPIIPSLGYGLRRSTDCDKIAAQNMTNLLTFPGQELFLVDQSQNDPSGTYSPKKGFLGNVSVSLEVKTGTTIMSLPGYISYLLANTRFVQRIRCFKKIQLAPITFNKTFTTESALNKQVYDWWNQHERTILGGIELKDLQYQSHRVARTLNYTIMTNKTLSSGHEDGFWMALMDEGYVKSLSNHRLKFEGLKNVPRPVTAISFDLAALMGPFLLIYVFQLMFPVSLSSLVFDREQKLLEIMKMMGLKTNVYWIVTYIFNYLLYTIAIGLMYGFAYSLNLTFFVQNDPAVLVIGFLLWGHTQIAFSFFLSVFFSKSKTSMVLGYFYVFGSGLVASQVVNDYFVSDVTPRATVIGLQCFPPFVLYRMLIILSENVSFGATGLLLKDISLPDVQMDEVWIIMGIQYAVFMILALYLDRVFPKSFGVRKHPLFFLQKSFWRKEEVDNSFDSAFPAQAISEKYDHEPEDVARDREALRTGPRNDLMLKILDITKEYSAAGGPKIAVDRLSLGITDATCFGFLGPNGAGKTTLINMICGLIEPTSGTAMIGTLDIRKDIDIIHAGMGVCPQEDILWDDLTGSEHLLFYARLKGLTGSALADGVKQTLIDVNLTDAKDKKAGEYSGGMKRRLSVGCALIGNPMLVLLDEPTTGLDPASRRRLWDVVRQYKRKSLVMLTTHSMEEADALCDRMVIMDEGHLKCIGTGPELKSRFGKGFKLTIIIEGGEEVESRAVKKLGEHFEGITMINSLGGVVNLEIPLSGLNLGDIFDVMEKIRNSLNISDWGVEHSTLEETFLRVVGVLDDGHGKDTWV